MEVSVNDNRPILVQFENGVLKDELRKRTQFRYLRSKVPKSNKRMLLADTGALTYAGSVLQKQNNVLKYYIGIVDKHSNTIEAIQPCQICTLKPKLQDKLPAKEAAASDKTFRQKSDNLVEAFGSAKQKRLVASRKKNEGVQETIGDKVADVAKKILLESPVLAKTPPKSSVKSDESFVVPPQDIDAKRVQDIYRLDDIISFQSYQFLKKDAQEFIDLDHSTLLAWKTERKYPEFILHLLSQLPLSSVERERRACYIRYLNYLISLYKLNYKDMQKKDPCPSIGNPLKDVLLNQFTHSENGRNRCIPKRYKDKNLCYIFVLALILEQYEMNCNLLLRDLKLGVTRITKLLRAIGCSVRTSNTKKRKIDEVSGETGPTEPIVMATLTLSSVKPSPKKKVKDEQGTPLKGHNDSVEI